MICDYPHPPTESTIYVIKDILCDIGDIDFCGTMDTQKRVTGAFSSNYVIQAKCQ